MKTTRIERMIREIEAEPAEQFVASLLALADRLWPKHRVAAQPALSVASRQPVQAA